MKGGKPYVMFGDGRLAACKPISEADLAAFIADCVQGEDRVNEMLPIGGKFRWKDTDAGYCCDRMALTSFALRRRVQGLGCEQGSPAVAFK